MPEKKEHRRPKRLSEAVASLFEVPVDAVLPMTICTIRGRREVEAAGCGGILAYGPERVVLTSDDGQVTVTGRMLAIEDFTEGIILVRGEIDAVTFGGEEA
ncbi:MAG: YabP/YqfC family sporulation protein [Clostridiales bacterium]|nr:YabP/YqfC family sporulation protein [Clostridiales bacterium]